LPLQPQVLRGGADVPFRQEFWFCCLQRQIAPGGVSGLSDDVAGFVGQFFRRGVDVVVEVINLCLFVQLAEYFVAVVNSFNIVGYFFKFYEFLNCSITIK